MTLHSKAFTGHSRVAQRLSQRQHLALRRVRDALAQQRLRLQDGLCGGRGGGVVDASRRALAEAAGAIALHPDEAMERIKQDTKGRKLDSMGQ